MTGQQHRCALCGRELPEDQAVYWAELRILTCQGACDERLDRAVRVYDRSRRGRLCSVGEVRRMLREGTIPA